MTPTQIVDLVDFNSQYTDILFLDIPLTISHTPLMAGAVLKSVANRAGFSCTVCDFNLIAVKWLQDHPNRKLISDFFIENILHSECETDIDEFFNCITNHINKVQPRMLALSVFTFHSRSATEYLCKKVRQQFPHIRIIIGGAGVSVSGNSAPDFGIRLKNEDLIDDFIFGDAELSFYNYLIGQKNYSGINSTEWERLNFDEVSLFDYPNYDDYKFEHYLQRHIMITGSKGCVRNCKFCDYIKRWDKFIWRSAEDIVAEMLAQREKYKMNTFFFSDSLINGNMKEFRKLIKLLADYNATIPSQWDQIKWLGQFIFRNKEQMKEDTWQLMRASGLYNVGVGIEAFNNKIRADLGKPFTNEDIDFSLKMMKKYNIEGFFMFIIGHLDETDQHIEEAKQWLTDRVEYKDQFIFAVIDTLQIEPTSWYSDNQKTYDILWIQPDNKKEYDSTVSVKSEHWVREETKNTPQKRNEWAVEIITHAVDLGYNVYDNVHTFMQFDQLVDQSLTAENIGTMKDMHDLQIKKFDKMFEQAGVVLPTT